MNGIGISGCFYVDVGSTSVAWTQVLPTLITLSLTINGWRKRGHEFFPTLFGFYLHVWQIALWVFQVHFNMIRPHPYCAQYETYVFPSQEAFYAAALAFFIVSYGVLWKYPLSWLTWALLWLLVVAPPFILLFFLYNTWWELLFSLLLGAVVTFLFVLVIRVYITPQLPYILLHNPMRWMGYIDTICMNRNERKCHRELREHLEVIDIVIQNMRVAHSSPQRGLR